MKISKSTKLIEKYLVACVPQKISSKFKYQDYFKASENKDLTQDFLNMTMPQVQSALKNLNETPDESYSEELLPEMQALWFESNIFEAKMLSLYWLIKQNESFLIKNAPAIFKWVNAVNNWAHSDAYCSVIARMYDVAPNKLKPTFSAWNKSQNPWMRRCSMVGLYYYSRLRQNHASFSLAAKLVNPHFEAPEYYVQKAVGWTLREMYNVYPEETLRYIQFNNAKLTSIAWVAATEKLPIKVKKPLLEARKQHRQSKTRL